jgi:hypothetical protein
VIISASNSREYDKGHTKNQYIKEEKEGLKDTREIRMPMIQPCFPSNKKIPISKLKM